MIIYYTFKCKRNRIVRKDCTDNWICVFSYKRERICVAFSSGDHKRVYVNPESRSWRNEGFAGQSEIYGRKRLKPPPFIPVLVVSFLFLSGSLSILKLSSRLVHGGGIARDEKLESEKTQ